MDLSSVQLFLLALPVLSYKVIGWITCACSKTVVPKLVRAVTQIKVTIMSYYPQYFAVIAHNTEQHCGFGSALPPKNRILPGG